MKTRPPAVSGYFYPSDEEVLRQYLGKLLRKSEVVTERPKCLIVPHAGYEYSGIVASFAYSLLLNFAGKIHKIILAGPSHRVPAQDVCVSSADYFETPLGKIPLSQDLRNIIVRKTGVIINDDAHNREHCIEVQLPFLQYSLGSSFEILPFVTNSASTLQLKAIFNELWGGEETIIVVSTDLSHYHTYEEARKKDEKTCHKIENMDFDSLQDDEACGNTVLRGILCCLKEKGLHPKCLDRRNSGDTGGDKTRVVGYAAFCA